MSKIVENMEKLLFGGGAMPQTYTTQGKELLLELYKSLQ